MKMPTLFQTYFIEEMYSRNHAHILHKHSDIIEILFIDSGIGRYVVGKRAYAVAAGDVVICNGGVLHGEAPFQEHHIQTYCIALKGIHVEGLKENCMLAPEYKPILNLGNLAETLKAMMKSLHMLFTLKSYQKTSCNYLAAGIFWFVKNEFERYEASERGIEDQKKEILVRRITDYIGNNYTEALTLKKISDAFYISQSSLSHLFKKSTGLSPIQYMVHLRIGEAQSLLMDTHIPIHRIEEELGFGSACHFSAMFKKYVGISPKEYRRNFIIMQQN